MASFNVCLDDSPSVNYLFEFSQTVDFSSLKPPFTLKRLGQPPSPAQQAPASSAYPQNPLLPPPPQSSSFAPSLASTSQPLLPPKLEPADLGAAAGLYEPMVRRQRRTLNKAPLPVTARSKEWRSLVQLRKLPLLLTDAQSFKFRGAFDGKSASDYALMVMKEGQPPSMQIIPLHDFVALRPHVLIHTLSCDEAEKKMAETKNPKKKFNRWDMLRKKDDDGRADEGEGEDAEGSMFEGNDSEAWGWAKQGVRKKESIYDAVAPREEKGAGLDYKDHASDDEAYVEDEGSDVAEDDGSQEDEYELTAEAKELQELFSKPMGEELMKAEAGGAGGHGQQGQQGQQATRKRATHPEAEAVSAAKKSRRNDRAPQLNLSMEERDWQARVVSILNMKGAVPIVKLCKMVETNKEKYTAVTNVIRLVGTLVETTNVTGKIIKLVQLKPEFQHPI